MLIYAATCRNPSYDLLKIAAAAGTNAHAVIAETS
jgi:hypothetical protein